MGSFLLVAASFAMLGRGLIELQWFHSVWLLLGAPAIWIAAGDRRWAAAIATTVYLFYVGMFTFNYSSWMVPFYAWSFAGIVRSLDTRRAGWALLAGACAMWATLTIQRAAVLGPLALGLWVLGERKPVIPLLWLGGAVVGALPLLVVYAAQGEALTLVHGVLPIATAREYGAVAVSNGWLTTAEAVVEQLFSVFGAGLLLVGTAAVARASARRGSAQAPARPSAAWLFLLASVLGSAMGGGRFYLHYLAQYVPAIALMAGDPALVAAIRRRQAFLLVPLAALVWAAADVSRGEAHRYQVRPRRTPDGRTACELAGMLIRERTRPDESVFVWGWSGWPLYYWSSRRAPGRIYKPLGTLTTFNSNTAFKAGRAVRFRPGPRADEFIAEFDRRPPAFVVVTQSRNGQDPLLEFTALEQRLQRHYAPYKRYDDLLILRRRGR